MVKVSLNSLTEHGTVKTGNVTINKFPPPVLHLKLMTVNHICDHLTLQTKKHCGRDLVFEFAKEESICRKSYHGGNYQGNQCNDIMKKVDKLEQKLPRKLKKFTKCLRKFKVIVDEVFGCQVTVTFQEILGMMEDFKKNYLPLKISVTPTVHDNYFHVPNWYEMHSLKRGLGWYSEQATESCHRDFMSNVWLKGYKVPDNHPEYHNKMQGAVAQGGVHKLSFTFLPLLIVTFRFNPFMPVVDILTTQLSTL